MGKCGRSDNVTAVTKSERPRDSCLLSGVCAVIIRPNHLKGSRLGTGLHQAILRTYSVPGTDSRRGGLSLEKQLAVRPFWAGEPLPATPLPRPPPGASLLRLGGGPAHQKRGEARLDSRSSHPPVLNPAPLIPPSGGRCSGCVCVSVHGSPGPGPRCWKRHSVCPSCLLAWLGPEEGGGRAWALRG
uniref:Uncharacterized protein n=1 Tax=Rousettus aegyptiacus TaxID=9407 RepID=A0A7J8FI10_ROUAE|nr:hypothetical protein HJG63_011829 [Rousettus aegyptiacus]